MSNAVSAQNLRHGGDLARAIRLYGGQTEDWLDLSTGISPWAYPVPTFEASVWRNLPDDPQVLIEIASRYYTCENSAIAVTPGSQLAIRILPTLIDRHAGVAIPTLGYREHANAWQTAQHRVEFYANSDELLSLIEQRQVEYAVIINPNNPSCETYTADALREISKKLPGLLVIDEAFADLDQQYSLCRDRDLANVLIFRSIGKFFALAGTRVGFVIGQNELAKQLGELFKPWPINGPAQCVAELALADETWQNQQREKINTQAAQVATLMQDACAFSNKNLSSRTHGLFATLFGHDNTVSELHTRLAKRHIWTRLGDPDPAGQNWLRLSLPGDEFSKLDEAFQHVFQNLERFN